MPEESFNPTVPATIVASMERKKFALVGFAPDEANLLSSALQETRSLSFAGDPRETLPTSEEVEASDVIVVNLTAGLQESRWMNRNEVERSGKPFLLVGHQSEIHRYPALQEAADDLMIRPFKPAEMLLRCHRIVNRSDERGGQRAPKKWAARVLLADDDKSIIDLLTAALGSHNIECLATEDGVSTLRHARRMMPDLVILDLNIPMMNGFEILDALRKDPCTNAIKVILLTANQDLSAIMKGRELGADDYVTKPFSHIELLTRVKKLVPLPAQKPQLNARRVFLR
jgi:DNA-binding response OmpR family regulator